MADGVGIPAVSLESLSKGFDRLAAPTLGDKEEVSPLMPACALN
jgi:hypothetical protein